jgi:hypothetical protein
LMQVTLIFKARMSDRSAIRPGDALSAPNSRI